MAASLRQLVRQRAGMRCEYCRLHESAYTQRKFGIEHIIARKHGGLTELHNLAWACPHCNECKGPNLTGVDPDHGTVEPLFNPRKQRWEEHFEEINGFVAGLTAIGRVTVRVLTMNEDPWPALRAVRINQPGTSR